MQLRLNNFGILAFCFAVAGSVCASPPPTKASAFDAIEVVATAPTIYPELSVVMGGTVVLQVAVDEAGRIERLDVVHGIPSLTEEAERSVQHWKFRPATLGGRPLTSVLVAAFSFSRPVPLGPTLKLAPQAVEPDQAFEPIQILSATPALYPAQIVMPGTVILDLTISCSGAIETIKTLHAIPNLTRQAKRAVEQWKFQPARLDGKPVASSMIASFTFASSILNNRNR